MSMYLRLISRRYILKRTTALLAVLAVTFGVATLLTVLSIMEGYVVELQAMIREQESHVIVRGGSPLGLTRFDFFEQLKTIFGGQTVAEGNFFLSRNRGLKLRTMPRIAEVAPYIDTYGMYRSGKFNPCSLRGIDPEREIRVTSLGKFLLRPKELDHILSHRRSAAAAPEESDILGLEEFQRRAEEKAHIILGDESRASCSEEEARRLFSRPWRRELFERENPGLAGDFDKYSLSSAVVGFHFLASRNVDVGQVVSVITMKPGTSEPVTANFLITGAFKTGDHEADSTGFLVSINRLKSLYDAYTEDGEGRFDGVRIALEDYNEAETVSRDLQRIFWGSGRFDIDVLTWKDAKQIFLEAVRTEKWIMWALLLVLNVFTGCMILLMLVLIVIEKSRDAGILLSMGATPGGVFSIFLLNGMLITAVGTALGLIVGAVFTRFLNFFHDAIYSATGYRLFDPEVYMMDHVPAKTSPEDIAMSVLPAVVAGLVASLLPALWASLKDPIRAIHHE